VLVDTSVWVDHLRRRNATLVELLEHTRVWTHSFVIGELACGNLANRRQLLDSLAALPQVPAAHHEEVLEFMEARRLMGRGLGWIDVHLLASATLEGVQLWTVDRRLAAVARELDVHFEN
jgi:predicted nucleic acid-binding protein